MVANTLVKLSANDLEKGADIHVRFNMVDSFGVAAPSKFYCGWVTRVTADDVVWIRFGRGGRGCTYMFDLADMVDNHDFVKDITEKERTAEQMLLKLGKKAEHPSASSLFFRFEM